MKSLSDLTLQKRVNLLVAVGMVVGLGLFSTLGLQSVNESTTRTLEERLSVARIIASRMDETLNHILVHTVEVASYITFDDFDQRSRELSNTLMRTGYHIEGVYLMDIQGNVLRTYPSSNANPPTGGDKVAIGATLADGKPGISPLVVAPFSGLPVAFAVAPLPGSSAGPTAMLGVAMDIGKSDIGGFISPLPLGNTGYTEIVDKHGVVITRTTPGRAPDPFEVSDHPGRLAMLMEEGRATVRTCHRCHGPESQPQRRRDVLAFAPLSAAPWGVAIRQSEDEAFAITHQLQRRLLILGAMSVVGVFLIVWVVTQGVVQPIKMLTAASTRVAAGDFKAITPLRRKDEIGQLSAALTSMTRDLARTRDDLWSRNQELTALNSIAATVSQTLRLEDVLDKALQKVLEVADAEAGCIFLRRSQDKTLEMVSRSGRAKLFLCEAAASASAACACHQVLRSGNTTVVNDVSQCPALAMALMQGSTLACFVSVPLQSKDKTLGVMNLACSRNWCVDEDDLDLLQSIGRHVGLAVDNSLLFEETKREEELRGRLLSVVMTAQEDERSRISRDLHDGFGQTLTGLIMNIESAEGMSEQHQSRLKAKLSDLRHIAVGALQELRVLMRGLRPSALDDLGLVAAVSSYAGTRFESSGIRFEFTVEGQARRLPRTVETALFRIAQEAINNIAKHAHAKHVHVSLDLRDSTAKLAVIDDGRGFDATTHMSRNGIHSLGLLGMRERATLLSGTFAVNSTSGQGTRIAVEVPVSGTQ